MESPSEWQSVCETMTSDKVSGALFKACLLVSDDSTAGSILVAGFSHVLGDAMSYSMFLRSWSDCYQSGKSQKLLDPPKIPTGIFQMASLSPLPAPTQRQKGMVSRCFSFNQQDLQERKGLLISSSGEQGRSKLESCSTNDILMAEFACAIAPSRLAQLRRATRRVVDPSQQPVQILVLADRRGRGVQSTAFGNYNADLSIRLSFQLLLTGDVATVARAIHEGVRSELHKLEKQLDLFNREKSQRVNVPTLFCWNSWARIGHGLRTALFGGPPEALLNVEWLNSYALLRHGSGAYDAVVVVSLCQTGLAIFVANSSATAAAEMSKVSAVWGDS